MLKCGDRGRIKVTINVQNGYVTVPITEKARRRLIIPALDEMTVGIIELRRRRREGPLGPGPPVLRDPLPRIETIDLAIRASRQEGEEGVARGYTEFEYVSGDRCHAFQHDIEQA